MKVTRARTWLRVSLLGTAAVPLAAVAFAAAATTGHLSGFDSVAWLSGADEPAGGALEVPVTTTSVPIADEPLPLPTTPPTSAPSSTTPESAAEEAQRLCDERLSVAHGRSGNEFNAHVIAAYPWTAGEAAVEHESLRHSGFRSPLRDRNPGRFAALCYFEADAFWVPTRAADGSLSPDVDTRLAEVVLEDRSAVGLEFGNEAAVPAENPTERSTR